MKVNSSHNPPWDPWCPLGHTLFAPRILSCRDSRAITWIVISLCFRMPKAEYRAVPSNERAAKRKVQKDDCRSILIEILRVGFLCPFASFQTQISSLWCSSCSVLDGYSGEMSPPSRLIPPPPTSSAGPRVPVPPRQLLLQNLVLLRSQAPAGHPPLLRIASVNNALIRVPHEKSGNKPQDCPTHLLEVIECTGGTQPCIDCK